MPQMREHLATKRSPNQVIVGDDAKVGMELGAWFEPHKIALVALGEDEHALTRACQVW